MSLSQLEHVEQGIQRISRRVAKVPAAESLICRAITILGRDLATRFDALLAPSGLSEIEFRVLLALVGRDGSAHPGELCGSLAQSPANMTRVSDLLVERGLVTRVFSEQDRRRVVIELTAAGDALVREVLPQLFATTRTLFQDFTAAEKVRLLGDLKRIFAALDAADAGDSSGAAP